MVIDDPDMTRACFVFRLLETKSPLLVDVDAVLPLSVAAERFKVIARQRLPLKALERPDKLAIGESARQYAARINVGKTVSDSIFEVRRRKYVLFLF
jgi:hypothetical protein